MAHASKTKANARKAHAKPGEMLECALDPLLVGADREFLDGFPKELIRETGILPIRRYRGAGLVVSKPGPSAARNLQKLQKVSDVRLASVPAIHDYGVDLFTRYWEAGGDGDSIPPLWLPPERGAYLHRLGDMLSG